MTSLMKRKPKPPRVPPAWHQTARQSIIDIISGRALTAKEISAEVGLPEKEVYEHLEHIRQSLARQDRQLLVTPARCKKCGFEFKKRERLKKPGRCPVCKGQAIEEPVFEIT